MRKSLKKQQQYKRVKTFITCLNSVENLKKAALCSSGDPLPKSVFRNLKV